MSYTIEHGKRVLTLPYGERKQEQLVFLHATSCNNVYPHRFPWNVVAVRDYSMWNGEIMLPANIWQMGGYADGGDIKPWNKDISGTNYIEQWKKAVRDRKPITGWTPQVSIWFGEKFTGQEINAQGAALFGKYEREELFAAFKRFFPDPLTESKKERHNNCNMSSRVTSHEELEAALLLYRRREDLPVSFYMNDEGSTFFKRD